MSRLVISLLGPLQITLDGVPVTTPLGSKTQALLAYLAAKPIAPTVARCSLGYSGPTSRTRPHATACARRFISCTRPSAQTTRRPSLSPRKHCNSTRPPTALWTWPHSPPRSPAARAMPTAVAQPADRVSSACSTRPSSTAAISWPASFSRTACPSRSGRWSSASSWRGSARGAAHGGRASRPGRGLRTAGGHRPAAAQPRSAGRGRAPPTHGGLELGGQRTAALAHYKALRQTIAAELDTPPEAETVALHGRIEAGTHERPRRPPLHNWPGRAQLTSFVGRDDEMAQIAERLGSTDVRLLTLLGPGGVGKTRLAVETAAREACGFQDGACWVALEAADTPELVVSAISTALRFALAGPAAPLAQLAAGCGCGAAAGAGQLRDLRCRGARAGRSVGGLSPLAHPGDQPRTVPRAREHRFPVAPLPTASAAPDVLASAPAVALFVDRRAPSGPTSRSRRRTP